MNTLLKVLCTLLNNKVTKYCYEQRLINYEQIGFQNNNSDHSDHILTLKAVVNKYVVDQNKGINGNFLKLIKSIHNNTKCAVNINKEILYVHYYLPCI